jgi:hypothetical protein
MDSVDPDRDWPSDNEVEAQMTKHMANLKKHHVRGYARKKPRGGVAVVEDYMRGNQDIPSHKFTITSDARDIPNREFLFGDFDGDGVPNYRDCYPFDKKRHSFIWNVNQKRPLGERDRFLTKSIDNSLQHGKLVLVTDKPDEVSLIRREKDYNQIRLEAATNPRFREHPMNPRTVETEQVTQIADFLKTNPSYDYGKPVVGKSLPAVTEEDKKKMPWLGRIGKGLKW